MRQNAMYEKRPGASVPRSQINRLNLRAAGAAGASQPAESSGASGASRTPRAPKGLKVAARRFLASTLALLVSWTAVVPVTSSAAFAQSSNEDVRFFHHDAHGAVIAVTDQSGQILERNSPRPFGDVHGSGSAAASQHSKFLDRPLEPTGLYELGERFYEPRYGRFLSQDPASLLEVDVTNPEGFNRFAYGLNNPYRYNDATGRIPVDTILDAADIAISFHDLWNEPSWTNGLFLAWSIGAVFLPYVPGAWIRHVGKGAKRLDTATEVAEAARAADRAADAARGTPKLLTQGAYRAKAFAQGQLDKHFAKHAAEWGAGNITKTGYLKRAQNLLGRDVGGDILGAVRKSGDVLKYNARTNEFAVGAADGTIRTLFRPQTGMDYWQAVTSGL